MSGFFQLVRFDRDLRAQIIQMIAQLLYFARHLAGRDKLARAMPIVGLRAQFVQLARLFELQFAQLKLRLRLRAQVLSHIARRRRRVANRLTHTV
jgi:hypothetical protein